MTDHPYKPFNDAVKNNKAEKQQHQEGPTPKNIRDKDYAEPRPKPPVQAKYPAPNVPPMGSVGIKRQEQLKTAKPTPIQQEPVSIVKTHEQPEYLMGGKFTDKPDYGFAVDVGNYRSYAGIDGGKINALEIQHQGKIVAQYQKMQWTMLPKEQAHIDLAQRLQDKFGEPTHEFAPIVPIEPNKDRGHDR